MKRPGIVRPSNVVGWLKKRQGAGGKSPLFLGSDQLQGPRSAGWLLELALSGGSGFNRLGSVGIELLVVVRDHFVGHRLNCSKRTQNRW